MEVRKNAKSRERATLLSPRGTAAVAVLVCASFGHRSQAQSVGAHWYYSK